MTYLTGYIAESNSARTRENLKKFDSKFGIEFECISPLSHETFRQKLAAVLGNNRVNPRAGGYGASGQYDRWSVTSDSSVHGRGHAVELISPILTVESDTAVTEISKVLAFLREEGCSTNQSCGMHITMSCKGLSSQSFKPYIFCALADDYRLVSFFNRTSNTYCVPTTTRASTLVDGLAVQESGKPHISKHAAHVALCSTAHRVTNYGKYSSVNICKLGQSGGAVEYRGVGGNYLRVMTTDTLFGIVRRLSASLIAATQLEVDPNKDEARKLHRFMATYFVRSFHADMLSDTAYTVEFPSADCDVPSYALYKSPTDPNRLRNINLHLSAHYMNSVRCRHTVRFKLSSYTVLAPRALGLTGKYASLPTVAAAVLRNPSPEYRAKAARFLLDIVLRGPDAVESLSVTGLSHPQLLATNEYHCKTVVREIYKCLYAFRGTRAFHQLLAASTETLTTTA